MPPERLIVIYMVTPILAGLLGVLALESTMWLMTHNGLARGNMIVAIGSLFTRSREHAFRNGLVVHLISGVVFAALYLWAMRSFGFTRLPTAVAAGVGFGTAHGIMVSLLLVWVVSDHHPLEEFKGADLAIGLSHFLGHVAYGAAVGLVVGLMLR